jgi:hypothetical protein
LISCVLGFLTCIGIAVWLLTPSIQSLLKGQFDILILLYGVAAFFGAAWTAAQGLRFFRLWRTPFPVVRLRPAHGQLGEKQQIEWRLPRQAGLQSLEIYFEGREEAKYEVEMPGMHGAEATEQTMKQVFSTLPVVRMTGNEIGEGMREFVWPETTMHSFVGGRSAIKWLLKLRGELRGGKMVEDDFTVTVQPGKQKR